MDDKGIHQTNQWGYCDPNCSSKLETTRITTRTGATASTQTPVILSNNNFTISSLRIQKVNFMHFIFKFDYFFQTTIQLKALMTVQSYQRRTTAMTIIFVARTGTYLIQLSR